MSAMNFSGAIALSGAFASTPISCVMYIDDCAYVPLQEEAAGKIGKYLAVAAAIIVPFAAPAVFGAIAGSGVLGASMAAAAGSAGFMGTMTGIIGSAITGGVMSAAAAFAGGARGGDVWSAFATGGLGSGFSAFRAGQAVNAAAQTASGVGGVSQGASSVTAGLETVTAGTAAAIPAAATTSPGIMQSIMSMIPGVGGNTDAMGRIGSMLINAAVNNQRMGRLDGLVSQQKAELEALRVKDRVAYDQKISEAQKILADADRMDPQWYARLAMADVAGMEETQFKQTMRNIAVRQGGSLDDGQQKAYERGQKLHTARSKALAYNQGFAGATVAQQQIRGQAAGLIGPDEASYRNITAQQAIEQGAYRERAGLVADTFAPLVSELNTPNHRPAETPIPDEEEDPLTRSFG